MSLSIVLFLVSFVNGLHLISTFNVSRLMFFISCLITYISQLMPYVLCLTFCFLPIMSISFVLRLMSYAHGSHLMSNFNVSRLIFFLLCPITYITQLTSYIFCLTSCVLRILSYVLFLTSYIYILCITSMSYALCFMSVSQVLGFLKT